MLLYPTDFFFSIRTSVQSPKRKVTQTKLKSRKLRPTLDNQRAIRIDNIDLLFYAFLL